VIGRTLPRPLPGFACAAILLASTLSGAADAAERIGVMGLRSIPSGAVSSGTAQAYNVMIWQRVVGADSVNAVAEHDVGSSMGAASATALTSCNNDACMAQIGAAAGLDRVLYSTAVKTADGFELHVRDLGVEPVQVLAERQVSCTACGEADVLQLLGKVDVVSVATAGRTASARAIADLKPKGASGSVLVESEPVGATVILDGVALGQTPVRVPAMAPGMYALLLDLAGHEEQLAELTVKARKESKVRVTMTAMASLRVTAGEGFESATVYVDGRPRGVAPVLVDALSAGEHEIIMMAPGRREARLAVPLAAGEEVDLVVASVPADAPESTTPPTGLFIESAPSNAAVRVDGEIKGFTPLTLDGLAPGRRTVQVSSPWHQSVSREVRVIDRALAHFLAPLPALPYTPVPQLDGAPTRDVGESKDASRHGPWIRLSDQGRRIAETRYDRGARHGLHATWYDAPGSPLNWAGAFHRGEPHGMWIQRSRDGAVTASGFYEHGDLVHGERVGGARSAADALKGPACPEGTYRASGVNVRANGSHGQGPVKTLRRWCEKSPKEAHGPRHDRSVAGNFWCATDYDSGVAHGRSVCWNEDGSKRSERQLVRGRVVRP